jgi:molybdopterin-guanine dinucleotide biosynthesis protein A
LTLYGRIIYRGYISLCKWADDLDISCIILAGGKSKRYGHDKILEKLGSTSLIEQVISSTDPLSKEIIIVTAKERSFAELEGRRKVKIVTDIFPGQGSLGGIYTGLVNSGSFYNLVVAADMPFLNGALLRYMIKAADGYDFTLPKIGQWYEPLHAIYSRNCMEPAHTLLKRGNKVIVELFNYVKVRFLETEEINRIDPRHLSFFNINTVEDMEKAREIMGEASA